jgi:hypothetical protein
MNRRMALLALPLAFGLTSCGGEPTAPTAAPPGQVMLQEQRPERGTGIALEDIVGLPVIGDVTVTQVVISEFSIFLGGLQASGTITGTTIDALGNAITVTNDFTTDVLVSSTGPGGCDVVTVDLAPIGADVFGVVGVDVPVANVTTQGKGPVGRLLCALGSLVNGVAGGVVRGLVNALNNLI